MVVTVPLVSVGGSCGAAHLTTAAGRLAGREVFRSWTSHDPHPPGEVLARHRYRHALPVPALRRAQDLVRAVDGVDGIHLAGSWTRDIGSHESHVVSAVEVARRLAPHRLDAGVSCPPGLRSASGTGRPPDRPGRDQAP